MYRMQMNEKINAEMIFKNNFINDKLTILEEFINKINIEINNYVNLKNCFSILANLIHFLTLIL